MNYRLSLFYIALAFAVPAFAGVSFSNTSLKVIDVTPAASTGLDKVYVLPETEGVVMTFDGASSSAKWLAFGSMGGAYSEEFATGPTAECRKGDMGYIVEDQGRQNCFWVVDYSEHALNLESLTLSEESDCGRIVFEFAGQASDIVYYTINGRRTVLSRELKLDWQTLTFDQENFVYNQTPASETIDGITEIISAPAPLCATTFVLSGDRFLQKWGREEQIELYVTDILAVEAQTRATQTAREADNEIKDNSGDLGGSAPCEVTFEAVVTDASIFTEWQISRSPEFTTIENSYNETEFTYTFTENGTTYVRFNANNAAGTCPFEGEVYQIFIGESKLDIPNAFSPGGSPGVNDEWKVSYKSLVSFECHIFNRWGKELFSTTDPSQGWDGKIGGKTVPSGVYFYVIKAIGADGVKYNKAGDINIIKYTEGRKGNSESAE